MKKLFLFSLIMLFSLSCFAQGLGWGFGGGNNTTVNVNGSDGGSGSGGGDEGGFDRINERESTWNLDLEGMAYIMPDQPAPDQFLSDFTGFGVTYKFSDVLHIVSKWMQFDIASSDGVVWHHEHMLAGLGARGFFGESQQWQINLLSGESTVEGNNGIGPVNNLELPVFLDIKYMWTFGGVTMGPQITFGRVANSCKDPNGIYTECGHGGYTAMSLVIQIGIPEEWGN